MHTLPARSATRDILALSALCAIAYFLGLTTHGLTNWQEAQRLLVAREMHDAGAWLIPTNNGQPYLAKPPLFYWLQITTARLRGSPVTEFDLRLAVALAGWLGVIATYLAARRLLARDAPHAPHALTDPPDTLPQHAAWWSALFLATGILYTRSSRVGELDILLAPLTVIAIAALHAAWLRWTDHRRTHWLALLTAAAASSLAALTKGPPAIMVITLGAFGGITLHAALKPPARFSGRFARLKSVWSAWCGTHPVGIAGAALAAFFTWSILAKRQLPPGSVLAAAAEEADDNLRLFVPEAPLNNLEALAYGVGLGSIACFIALFWIIKDRPTLSRGTWILLAWLGLGFIAFSVLGKGVARYLTPLWPAVAMLGGLWFTCFLRDLRSPIARTRLAIALTLAAVLLGVGQGAWYGFAREHFYSHRSPRALVAALAEPALNVDPARLVTLDFRTPAIDYYVGRFIQPVGDVGMRQAMTGAPTWSLEELADRVRSGGPYTLLARAAADPAERLAALGLIAEPLPLPPGARFTIDSGRRDIIALTVRSPAAP